MLTRHYDFSEIFIYPKGLNKKKKQKEEKKEKSE